MKILLVVGPSGAGKDTLLRGAKTHFAKTGKLGFVRRYITRPPDNNEDNYFIDQQAFIVLKEAGFFLSNWQAHSNHYGISQHDITRPGGFATLLCSISRNTIKDFETRFADVTTIHITAPEEVLAKRLQARGREDAKQIERRIQRARQEVKAQNLIVFSNSYQLEKSLSAFNSLLEKLCHNGEIANSSSVQRTVQIHSPEQQP